MVQKPNLREYQERCVSRAIEYLNDHSRLKPELIVAPTAAGKSLIIAAIAERCDDPLLVLQPSATLLGQNHEKLLSYGYNADIYSASAGQKTLGHITFATLGSIKDIAEEFKMLGVKTVLIDEAHQGYPPEPGSMFMNFMNELKPRKVIGLTATPFLLRNGMFGAELKLLTRKRPKFYHDFIDIIQIQELTTKGYWAKLKYKLYDFDDSGLELNSSGSDFTEESMARVNQERKINNKIYLEVLDLQSRGINSILVFMDSVQNVEIIANHPKMKDATFIHGKLPKKVVQERIEKFKCGEYKVMFNFGMLTTGFDYPDLRCVILGRPTLSLALYYQIIGRLTRISKETGKTEGLFIDFCGTAHRFGRVEDLELKEIPVFENGGVSPRMAMVSCGIVLTNVPLKGLMKTVETIAEGPKKKGIVPFGKYKGKQYSEVPIDYIKYLFSIQDFNWSYPSMQKAKKIFQEILDENQKHKEKLKLNF